jgi:hypothetical protein
MVGFAAKTEFSVNAHNETALHAVDMNLQRARDRRPGDAIILLKTGI